MWNDARVGWSIASNTLRRGNRKTTVLTVSVLTLIFVNLIFLPSMINGMTDIFTENVIDFAYGNILIEPSQNNQYISNADSLLRKVDSVTEVTDTSKRLVSSATLSYRNKYVGANLYGIDPEMEMRVSAFDDAIIDGEYLSRLSRNEIVLGQLLAGDETKPDIYESLGGVRSGAFINVTFSTGETRRYKVKGVHQGVSELADLVALVHYRELEEILGIEGEDKTSQVIIRIDELGKEPEVKQKLLDMGVKEKVETWQEKIQDLMEQVLDSFNMLTNLSVVVSLLIAVFVLFITIYINTIYKKKQIGILKAIGITPKSIILSYMILSFFFTVAGIAIGAVLLAVVVTYFTAYPIYFYESMFLAPKVDHMVVLQAIASLISTSFIAGFIPSWLVTREPILKSIWGR